MRRPHTWAGNYSPPGRGYVVLRLTLEDGTAGWGEAQVLKDWGGEYGTRSGESHETTKVVIEELLAPIVIGEDVRAIENVHGKMDKFVRGYPYAKAAIDVAMHDARRQALRLPVYQLLGGLVRRAIPLAHSIGLMEIDAAVAEAQAVVDEGITTIKVKVGVDAARDIELVERLRKTLGPDVKLRVDANQGYRTWKEALRVTRVMADYDIGTWSSRARGSRTWRASRRATDVPIMADESAWSAHDVLRLIEWKAAEMVSVYYTKPGGLMKAKKLLAVAETGGLLLRHQRLGRDGRRQRRQPASRRLVAHHRPAGHDPGHLDRRDRPHQGRRAQISRRHHQGAVRIPRRPPDRAGRARPRHRGRRGEAEEIRAVAALPMPEPIREIAIIGAGNGGCAAAADLTLRGFSVRLYGRSAGDHRADPGARRHRALRRARRALRADRAWSPAMPARRSAAPTWSC